MDDPAVGQGGSALGSAPAIINQDTDCRKAGASFESITMTEPINRNTTITFLSMLVPGLTDSLKYAVVARAVAAGDLTVIANAANYLA